MPLNDPSRFPWIGVPDGFTIRIKMQSVEKSRVPILISPYPSHSLIFVDRVVRYWRKRKYKCDPRQLTLLVYCVDLSAEAEGYCVVKLYLKKHSLSILRWIRLVSTLTWKAVDVILHNVVLSRFGYQAKAFVVIAYLAIVQIRNFYAGAWTFALSFLDFVDILRSYRILRNS
jgi:hypothetical protein